MNFQYIYIYIFKIEENIYVKFIHLEWIRTLVCSLGSKITPRYFQNPAFNMSAIPDTYDLTGISRKRKANALRSHLLFLAHYKPKFQKNA